MTSMSVSLNFEVLLSIMPDADYHLSILTRHKPRASSNTTNCHFRFSQTLGIDLSADSSLSVIMSTQ